LPWHTLDQIVTQPLVIPFVMVMPDEVGERPSKMAFAERDHAIEAFFLDGAYESRLLWSKPAF
jgi:hypothetical protein